jgi:hypothetical protein
MIVKVEISLGKCINLLLAWWHISFKLYACNNAILRNPSCGVMMDSKSCLLRHVGEHYDLFPFMYVNRFAG